MRPTPRLLFVLSLLVAFACLAAAFEPKLERRPIDRTWVLLAVVFAGAASVLRRRARE